MIADLNQPAKAWLADIIQNFGSLMASKEDPSMEITYQGMKIEIRLMELRDLYKRESK